MQTWRESAVEEVTKAAVGIPRIIFLQRIILPFFGIHISVFDNLGLSAIFYAAALATNYPLRRLFNWLQSGHEQSWRQSFFEEGSKTGIGYLRLVLLQTIVLPWFGINLSSATNWLLAAVFYAGVIATNYPVRRIFDHIHAKGYGLKKSRQPHGQIASLGVESMQRNYDVRSSSPDCVVESCTHPSGKISSKKRC